MIQLRSMYDKAKYIQMAANYVADLGWLGLAWPDLNTWYELDVEEHRSGPQKAAPNVINVHYGKV